MRVERQSTKSPTQQTAGYGSGLRWAANIGYAGLLIGVAMVPSTPSIVDFSPPDWLAHALAYGLQSVLLFWAALPTLGRRRAMAVGLFGAAAFGAVTEALQFLQPTRSVEVRDLVANIVGALVACGVIAVAGHFLRRGRR